MVQKNNHKNWLNIVIITVSGLILAFTLLGRFFESGQQSQLSEPTVRVEQFELIGIDFGQLQLNKLIDEWHQQPQKTVSQVQLEQLISQWNSLLGKPIQASNPNEPLLIQSASTVLLYLKGETRPIICKVVIAGKQAFVEFLASGQKVIITTNFAKRLLPPANSEHHQTNQPDNTIQPNHEETDA